MRLLYVANEPVEGWQRGTRGALDQLVVEGRLDATATVPLDLRSRQLGSFPLAVQHLCEAAADLRPDAVLWHHPARLPLTAEHVAAVRTAGGDPVVAFQEYDAWGAPSKPLDAATRALAAAADVVYLCAMGPNEAEFRRAGARDVRHTPHTCEHARFAPPPGPRPAPTYDVVMTGNLYRYGVLRRTLPGGQDRRRVARLLHRRFGDRFGLFGSGWGGRPAATGTVDFGEQGGLNRSARVSVGWDHFPDYDRYFSDRLPIALASGVPHVTNRQPGYGSIFPEDCGLVLVDSVEEMADAAAEVAALGDAELAAMGEAATTFAREHLDTVVVLRRVAGELAELVGR